MPANVLIVDDSATMRGMIRKSLEMSGLDVGEVREAGNGIEAFARLADHNVALVLLDLNMPVMNGLQFLARLQDDPRLHEVPVVIASTEGSEPRIAHLREKGARGYIRKPFHPEQLRAVLSQFIGLRPTATPNAAADDASLADDLSF